MHADDLGLLPTDSYVTFDNRAEDVGSLGDIKPISRSLSQIGSRLERMTSAKAAGLRMTQIERRKSEGDARYAKKEAGLRRRPNRLSSASAFPNGRLCGQRPLQQPRQIDPIILSTFASSRSMAGLVPSSGPFIGWAVPDDESAVPAELVPGAEGLVPAAPPVTEPWCDPMPPPRANAVAVERLTKRATQRTESFFMPRLSRTRDLINVTVDRRCACM